MLFIVAGVDTTASTLSIIMYCLACFPQVQHQLYLELDSFRSKLQARDGEKGAETYCFDTDALNQMEYLSAFIWEAMRFIPAVPRIDRRSTEDCYLNVNGQQVFVPKDTIITIPTYAFYRNSSLFERPDDFWPERFMRSKTENQSEGEDPESKRRVSSKSLDLLNAQPPMYRGVYFPFAMGIRDCIGKLFALLELKTVIAHVVLNYEVKAAPQTKVSRTLLWLPFSSFINVCSRSNRCTRISSNSSWVNRS
jgi:cytochrome P450